MLLLAGIAIDLSVSFWESWVDSTSACILSHRAVTPGVLRGELKGSVRLG
jgi:hypothetical protein